MLSGFCHCSGFSAQFPSDGRLRLQPDTLGIPGEINCLRVYTQRSKGTELPGSHAPLLLSPPLPLLFPSWKALDGPSG